MKAFSSGLLAGVVSAVIWMAVAMMVDFPPATIGALALAFLVVVTLISTVVTVMIGRSKRTS